MEDLFQVLYRSGVAAISDATQSKILNFLYEVQIRLGYCQELGRGVVMYGRANELYKECY